MWGQGGRALARRFLAWFLLCLPRELLGSPQDWPLLLASCLVPGALQLTSLPLLPESPRYLFIDRGDAEACLAGESLTSGPKALLTKGHIFPEHVGPHFLGFLYQGKAVPLFVPSIHPFKSASHMPRQQVEQTQLLLSRKPRWYRERAPLPQYM